MATVHDLTIAFNALVVTARERGVARWAKHHKSDFGTKQGAEDALARLRKELGPSEVDKAAARMAKFNAAEDLDTNEPGDLSPEVEGLPPPTQVYLSGQPVPMTVRVRPPGEVDITDPLLTLVSVNWEVDITWPAGEKATHHSMAPHWVRAAGLALSAAGRGELGPGDPVAVTEVTLTIRRA